MARYNTLKSKTVKTVTTHQGGQGFKYEPKIELVSILATGIDNKFYEKESDRTQRLTSVIAEVAKKDKNFVAKALVYARSVMGQRTVTHLGAVELAKYLSGDDLGKRFYSKRNRKENRGGIVYRLDDMLEITACYQAKNPGKPLSNAIKKGFKAALEAADAYELAKYQAKTKDISLVDIVNLVHPKPSEKMKPIFEKLMRGELKQFNTVEDKNTFAGQEIAKKVKEGEITKEDAAKELAEAKESNYAELIRTRKIGYLALLRNLRNILKNSSDKGLINEACGLLTDEKFVRTSLVFPHQIDLALEILIQEFSSSQIREVVVALNRAYELSIPNLTELFTTGRTAIVYDGSGSMTSAIKVNNKKGSDSAINKAALIAATLAKGIGGDVYQFSDSTNRVTYNPGDSINSIKNKFRASAQGGGTYFGSIFGVLDGAYDRIFVISDMQGADDISRQSTFQAYKAKHGINPHIYAVDLCGYGTTMFKGDRVYQILGYSADIYELIKKVEIDPKALIKEIEAIEI